MSPRGKLQWDLHPWFYDPDESTYIVILFKVCLFDLYTLSCRAIGQDVNDGLLVGPWRKTQNIELFRM